jgi:hypothetical protein
MLENGASAERQRTVVTASFVDKLTLGDKDAGLENTLKDNRITTSR